MSWVAASLGMALIAGSPSSLERTGVNVFFDPGGGSFGVSVSYNIAETSNSTNNFSITRSSYQQLLPNRYEEVPFR